MEHSCWQEHLLIFYLKTQQHNIHNSYSHNLCCLLASRVSRVVIGSIRIRPQRLITPFQLLSKGMHTVEQR